MKLNFFKRLVDLFRQPFKKEKPETVAEAVIVDEAETAAKPGGIPRTGSENCMKQARYFLFKEGRPIGRPFGRRSEIRIVYVNNFVESFLFFLRLCDQRLLTYRQAGGHLDCTATFPDGSGRLIFTDRTTCRNKAVIAVLKLEINGLYPRLSEIRFEIKHLKK